MITKDLSSDILERQFGPTTVRILHQDKSKRIIQTVASTNQILELSLVRFIPKGVQAYPEVHQAILGGQSIGKAFRAADIEFRRQEEFARKHNVPHVVQQVFGTGKLPTVVSVLILVGTAKLPYARITETYTGEASWPHLFGKVTDEALADLETLAAHLL